MKIILFNGPPRSGKDTASNFALEFLGIAGVQYRFAAPLKKAVHGLFNLSPNIELFDAVKEQSLDVFFGMTPREAYIWMSEEVAKPKFGKDFFTRVAINAIKNYKDQFIIISDCGFKEEVIGLIAAFGAENIAIVHMERDGTSFEKDSRSYISDAGCKEFKIVNNGQLYNLRMDVEKVIEEFICAK